MKYTLSADSDGHSPNGLVRISLHPSAGDFQVIFQGYEIGTARSQPISVKPQSHAVVGANSTVRLSYDSFDALTTEALLHARDSHMAKLLRSEPFAFDRTVCVVGMAHMDGVARRYTDASWKEDSPWKPPKDGPRQGFQETDFLSLLGEAAMRQKLKLHDMYRGWGQLHVEYSSERTPRIEKDDWPHAPFYDPKVDPISRLSYWLPLADHFRYPHVLHFASLPEMLHMVHHTNWADVSVKLRAHNRKVIINSEQFYRRSLLELIVTSYIIEYNRILNISFI
eukprot:g30122.t1